MHNLKLPPGMLALSTGPEGGELEERPAHGYRFPADYEALDEGPFADYSDAVNFRANELHPDLERTSMIVGDRGGTYSIHVPRALRQQIAGRGQADVMNPTHAVHAPAEPDFYDPAYPKVQVWHNDIAYTAPRHPDAVSDEHAKAMAELEVHRRHTAKLRKQLADFPENASNNPEESERFSQLENRVGDAEGHLRQLRLIEGAHRTLAAGLTNPGYRLKKGTIYLGADRYMRMDPEQAFTSVADAMGAGNAKQHITKIPGVWMIVDRRGDVMRHALRNNTDAQGWNNTKEGFVAQNPQWFMTPRLPSDMSKLPIAAWGKTRKKTGEWFSNLPPGMQAPPLELAGSDPVEQEPWKIQNTTGEPWNMRAEPWKVKEVRIGDGPDDTLHYLAAPRTPPEFTPELEAIRHEHGLDVPHSLTVLRGRRMRYKITGEGKAPQFLSHGHHAIRELLAEHRPVSLSFSAEEPKRQRLYYRLMQNLAKDPVASKQYKFYGAPDHYYFHIVHNSVAGMAPMYHKTSTMEINPGEHASVLPPGMRRTATADSGKSVATSNLPPGMIALAGDAREEGIQSFGENKQVHAPEITDALLHDHPITPQAVAKFQDRAQKAGIHPDFIDQASQFFSDFNHIRSAGHYAILPPSQNDVVIREGVLNTAPVRGIRRHRLDKLYAGIKNNSREVEVGRLRTPGEAQSVTIPKEIRGAIPRVFLNLPLSQPEFKRVRPASLSYPLFVTGNPHLTDFQRPHPSWDSLIKAVRVKPVYRGTQANIDAVAEAINYANEIGARVLVTPFRSNRLWQLANATEGIVPTDPAHPDFQKYWRPNPRPRTRDNDIDWTPYVSRERQGGISIVGQAMKTAGWDTPRSTDGSGSAWWWPKSRELDPRILEQIDPHTQLEFCDMLHKGCTGCRNCQTLSYPQSMGAPIYGVTDEETCENGCPSCFTRARTGGVPPTRGGISISQNSKQEGFGDPVFGDIFHHSIAILKQVARKPGRPGIVDYVSRFAVSSAREQMAIAASLYANGRISGRDLRTMQAEIQAGGKPAAGAAGFANVSLGMFALRLDDCRFDPPQPEYPSEALAANNEEDSPAEHLGRKHPGDMDLSEFLPASKYDAAIRSNYFDGPAHIHSSRETPATNQIHVPIGTWRIDDTFPGIYGHTIDQLRELDPHTLHLPEGDYTKEGYNPEGRGWDAERYAQWMKAGHQPPPIEVMQYGGDTWLPEGAPQLGVINGHRRTAAAKMAGKKILAWVSPTVKSGRTDYAGRPMTTGLTWELAKHHRGTLTPEELEKLPELKRAIAGLPQDPDSIVFANEQQSQRFERLHANPYEEAPDPAADPEHPRYGPGGAYEGQIPWTEPEIDPETGNLLWPQEEHAAAAVVLPHLRGGKPSTARQLATKHGIPGLPPGMKALKAEG